MSISLHRLATSTGHSESSFLELAEKAERGEESGLFSRHQWGRQVYVPTDVFRIRIKTIAHYLSETLPKPADHVHGFVKGRSIVTNASCHLSQRLVIRVDLQDFFDSIDRERIQEALVSIANFDTQAAKALGEICLPDGFLPTGFSTSPGLSNLAFASTDDDLVNWQRENGIVLTRYVDDICISGNVSAPKVDELRDILIKHDWRINESKTRYMRRGRSQYVTGLSVSDGVSVRAPRALKRRMRVKLHLLETIGPDEYFSKYGGDPYGDYRNKILGQARYIAMVEPQLGGMLLRRLSEAMEAEVESDDPQSDWEAWAETL